MLRIKELRNQKKLRQTDLAELLKTTQQTIARYENGEREPDIATVCALCDFFDCSADYLLGRSLVGGLNLTLEEESLILAFRHADARARDMVNLALEPFKQEGLSAQAI